MKVSPRAALLLLVLGGFAGCAVRRAEAPEASVYLTGRPSAEGYRLTLVPARGVSINARIRPTLELEGGEVVQFDQPSLTADSSYFAAPPQATVHRDRRRMKGVLRVGVCPAGLNVCRALVVPIDTVLTASPDPG